MSQEQRIAVCGASCRLVVVVVMVVAALQAA
jgi:hypothetical protein